VIRTNRSLVLNIICSSAPLGVAASKEAKQSHAADMVVRRVSAQEEQEIWIILASLPHSTPQTPKPPNKQDRPCQPTPNGQRRMSQLANKAALTCLNAAVSHTHSFNFLPLVQADFRCRHTSGRPATRRRSILP